jgi:hypothetical protein
LGSGLLVAISRRRLHFEIHVHGVAIDPAPALRRWDRYF